jgi:hypothetical protein
VSQSLGSIQGAVDLAANPRFTNAVFNTPGATLVDVLANPKSEFHARLLQLIAPVEEGTADYLKLLQVAKWILDPADPANFAGHVTANRLESPLDDLPGLPETRSALTQSALCDPTIPNEQNALFSALLGLAVPAAGAGTSGYVQWYVGGAGTACPDDGADHGFLIRPVDPTLTTSAQAAAADFLADPAPKPATVRP